MKKNTIGLKFLYLFIPLVILEFAFRAIQLTSFDLFTVMRVILFQLFFSIIVTFICTRFKSKKVLFVVGLIIVICFSAYAFVELIFKNYMGDFYSFGTVSDGAARIAQFAYIFLSNAKLKYYLCLIPIPVYVLLFVFVKLPEKVSLLLMSIIYALSIVIFCLCMFYGNENINLMHTYATFSNKDVLIDKLGVSHFLFRDLSALAIKEPETIVIEQEEQEENVVIIENRSREIDDSLWDSIAANETNENMKTIDSYLRNKQITQPNEMTGEFEGYDFIYFLVESGDYLMIDKELTPNLYELYTNGITFANHYTPLYSCATGESEFVSYNSIFPYVNTCTPNYVQDTPFYNALPWLFKNEGYDTFGIHNWRDEWYDRNQILANMGIDEYYDIDDIWQDPSIEHTNGWQSDSMLIEQAYKHIQEFDGNYFAMIISSTMHFPYDESSYWGDHYLDEVRAVHPTWSTDFCRYMSKSMDFDKGVGYLLDELKKSGKLDHTVISLYCDHRPYWVDYDKLIEYTAWINDRSEYPGFGDSGDERIGIYRSPFIVYNSQYGKLVNNNYCSTLDHVPTIANLFNLDYDPRLYIGKDAFSSSNPVIFTNGDWLTDKGIYDYSTGKFTPKGEMPDQSYIDSINKQVQNQINISYLILDESYFEVRKDICIPKLLKPVIRKEEVEYDENGEIVSVDEYEEGDDYTYEDIEE